MLARFEFQVPSITSFFHIRLSYSEGKMLTKDDEKTYWGKISYDGEDEPDEKTNVPSSTMESTSSLDGSGKIMEKRLYVKGSVIFGSGLEPLPVGRFIMRETIDAAVYDDEDDGSEEISDMGDEIGDGPTPDDFMDWTNAFQ